MATFIRSEQALQVESAIINNQPLELEALLSKIDINMCMNTRQDSPLFLAVRLSHRDIVRTLLSSPNCDLNRQNINFYTPLDLALVMVYDNQKEPRKSACWEILELLLRTGAEPACPDATLYVIRTAMKLNDDSFVLRLISTLTNCSHSLDLHSLLLCKIHRNQPMYSGNNSDAFLIHASDFTMKLIEYHHTDKLPDIVSCFSYYFDAHWESRKERESLFIKLIVFVTVMGWKWTDRADLSYIAQINPNLAQWCQLLPNKMFSLTHCCRIALTKCPASRKYIIKSKVPYLLQQYLKYMDIKSLVPFHSDFDFSALSL